MPRLRLLLTTALLGAASLHCAFPVGSRARPAEAMAKDRIAVGVGGLVPLGFVGQVDFPGDDRDATDVSQADVGDLVPVGSFDWAIGDGEYAGVDISYTKFGAGYFDLVVINPRFEYPFGGKDRNFSLTFDANFMYANGNDENFSFGAPFMQPMMGVRYYLDLHHIGFVISQSIGTSIISFYAPGGISIDVPIRFGDGLPTLHFMPEFRWDPTIFVAVARFVMFSAGGVVMLEF
ncbi:MAG: hypothetical protein RIT81_24815 [Deltaproteobacteria bacterium]